MRPALYLRSMVRESRGLGARLGFFVGCLAVGVAAVVAVAGLSASLESVLRAEARPLLAADVAVEGQRPVPSELDRILRDFPGVVRTDVRTMASVVSASGVRGRPGPSRLVRLKAVRGEYPFYGKLGLEPDRPLVDLLGADGAVVAPELLAALRLAIGGTLRIGQSEFRVAGVVRSEPDRLDVGFSLGPRVFLSAEGLARAGLEVRGSRVSHRALLKLREGSGAPEAAALAERIRKDLPNPTAYQIETYAEAQPALRNALRRAERFLGLVALLSLLMGGIGVAQTVRSWLAGRMDAIAVLKCLGMRPREVLGLYLGQTILLGLAGSMVGAAAGTILIASAPAFLAGLVPARAVHAWQPGAMLKGIALGVGVAALFALPQLATVRRVPPMRVIRRDVEPLPAGRVMRTLVGAMLVAGIFAASFVQSGEARLAAGFTGGILAVVAALAAGAWFLSRAVAGATRRFARIWVRHGLASVARPGADTLGSMLALGLGTLIVLAMHLVESRLSDSLRADLPTNAPNAFLVDVEPDQWEGVRELLETRGAAEIRSVPIVNARLVSVDGRPVQDMTGGGREDDRRRRWALTREQNLTYLRDLPDDNRIVEGEWWSDPAQSEVSLEREFAGELEAKVGSTLAFDVQGIRVDLRVTSLRQVEWKSFRPNFFVVIEPGVLESAPQFRVVAARLVAGSEQEVQDALAAAFPNVVVINIREVLEKIAAILEKVGRGVRALGAFTALAGVAILAGAVGATTVRRGREVAILKTLGMTRLGVVAVFAVEHAVVGLVAGAIGATGGGVLAWAVVTRGMDLEWRLDLLPFLAALVGCAALAAIAGTVASGRALTRRPVEVLRAEG